METIDQKPKRTAFPTNVPTRSPYEGSAISRMVAPAADPAPVSSGPAAPPKRTAFPSNVPTRSPYEDSVFSRMAGGGQQPAAAPTAAPAPVPARPRAAGATGTMGAAAAMAAPMVTPELGAPVAGTMPLEPVVEGQSVNPLADSGLMAGTRAVLSSSGDELARLRGQGRYGAMIGETARASTALVPALIDDVAVRPLAPVVSGAIDAGRQFLGMNDPAAPKPGTVQAAATSAAAKLPNNPTNPASNTSGATAAAPAAPAARAPAPSGGAGPAAQAMAEPPTSGRVNVRRQANGVLEFSGENVSGPVSYQGAQAAGFRPSGAGVSVVPGMAPGEAQRILARPFDQLGGLNAAQRAQYEAEVAQANAINQATLRQGRGGTISDFQRRGDERRAAAIEESQASTRARDRMADTADQRLALDQRRLASDEETSSVQRQAAQVELEGNQQLQRLREELISAPTPAARAEAAKKIQQLSGRAETPNRFTVIPGGSTIDPNTGQVLQRPGMVLDNSTGQLVNLGQQGATPARQGARPTTYEVGKTYELSNGKSYRVVALGDDGQPRFEPVE